MARAAKQPSWGSPWRAANDSSPRPVSSSSAVVCKACKRSFLTRDFIAKHVCKPPLIVPSADPLKASRANGTKMKYQVLAGVIEQAVLSGTVGATMVELWQTDLLNDYNDVTVNAAIELLAYDGLVLEPAPAPAAATPTGLTVVATNSRTVQLTWTASCNAVTYNVLRNRTVVASVTGTRTAITRLAPSTMYSFTVEAVNPAGTSPPSAPVNAMTSAVPKKKLPEPTPATPAKKRCSDTECDKTSRARGMCTTHYKRALTNGEFEVRAPAAHSTDSGYHAHLDKGQKPCQGCRKAHAVANRPRQKQTALAAV